MKYDVKAMNENPCVYKADVYGITLKTAFRVKLFKLWKDKQQLEACAECL